jgi:hypothetical protein
MLLKSCQELSDFIPKSCCGKQHDLIEHDLIVSHTGTKSFRVLRGNREYG